jgi:predicted Fe-S protein YdhL (DUF1289 family)
MTITPTDMPAEIKVPLELTFTIERAKLLEPVGSPCTDVCRLDKITGHCEGCFRSREEIKAWKTMADNDKLVLFDILLARKAAL